MDLKLLLLGAVVVNGLLILHELGHYLAARSLGLSIPEFSVGFGPRLFGVTFGETAYSLRLFPIAGYVLLPDLAPEPDEEPVALRRRFLTVLAGPLANFALVALLLGPRETIWAVGMWFLFLGETIRDLVLGAGAPPGAELLGPIGMSHLVGQAAANGWQTLLRLTALLSLNLGLVNLLPLPGLDGGRLIGLMIERLNGGQRSAWEPLVQGLGLVLILGLGLWLTGRELLIFVGWL